MVQDIFAYIVESAVDGLRSFGWYWKVPAGFLALGFLFLAISATRIGAKLRGLDSFGKRLVGCGTMLVALPVALVAGAIALALLAGLVGFREG